jgi:uncharacterized protein
MTDSVGSFSAMLRKALGSRIASDADTFLDMIAEDGVMEFPYSPPGFVTRLDGKMAITRHLEGLADMIAFDRMGEPAILETTDPQVVVVEFEGFGRGSSTGEPYDQRYISVIRTDAGRIVHYRDYWNPLVLLRALKGSAVVDAVSFGAHEGG